MRKKVHRALGRSPCGLSAKASPGGDGPSILWMMFKGIPSTNNSYRRFFRASCYLTRTVSRPNSSTRCFRESARR
jgi:hypothetical protein